jgi:hypothetical protein
MTTAARRIFAATLVALVASGCARTVPNADGLDSARIESAGTLPPGLLDAIARASRKDPDEIIRTVLAEARRSPWPTKPPAGTTEPDRETAGPSAAAVELGRTCSGPNCWSSF